MEEALECPAPALLLEDALGVGVGIARVHDKRQCGATCCRGVGAKGARLGLARAVLVVVIEARLADADHAGMPREPGQQLGVVGPLLHRGLVRMHADRAPHLRMVFREPAYAGEPAELGRDGDQRAHTRRLRAREHAVELVVKLGEIEVAMAVDEGHLPTPASAPGSGSR